VTVAMLRWNIGVENFILLVKGHQATYDGCHSEHRNRNCIASVWVKIAREMGAGKRNIITVISVAVYYYYYYYCLMLKFSYVIFGVGNNVNKEASCWLPIKDSVMCVLCNNNNYYYYHHHHQGMACMFIGR
jgi:hypothetical protein